MLPHEVNKKRKRVKTVFGQKWARVLVRPETLKVVVAVGRTVAQLLQIALSIIKIFRQ